MPGREPMVTARARPGSEPPKSGPWAAVRDLLRTFATRIERLEARPAPAAGRDGRDGAPGRDGIHGQDGAPGPQGARGEIGPAGPAGEPGIPGPQGIQGERGEQGPRGEIGPTGGIGPQGAQGERGEAGVAGERGPQGEQGPQGQAGERGPVGPQGIQGERGEAGPEGPRGLQGDPGIPGPIGERGLDGRDGLAGRSITRTDIDETGRLVLHFTDGGFEIAGRVRGERGVQGERGPQGHPGRDGINGHDGVDGAPGARGPRGQAGANGISPKLEVLAVDDADIGVEQLRDLRVVRARIGDVELSFLTLAEIRPHEDHRRNGASPGPSPFKDVPCRFRARAAAGKGSMDLYGIIGADWFGEGITSKMVSEALKGWAPSHRSTSTSIRPAATSSKAAASTTCWQHKRPRRGERHRRGELRREPDRHGRRRNHDGRGLADDDPSRQRPCLRKRRRDRRSCSTCCARRRRHPGEDLRRAQRQQRGRRWTWMDAETWMTADEAVARGFATKAEAAAKVAALSLNRSLLGFKHIPAALRPNRAAALKLISGGKTA
jgi:hypothetical protein